MKLSQKKSLLFFAVLFAAALITFSACRKDPQEIVELLTNSEAGEIVETAVASKTAGFTMPVIDATQIVETYLNNCNTPGDTTVSKSKTGVAATYDYTFNMDWLVTCSNLNLPQTAEVNIAANGAFTSQHWNGNEATSGKLTYTGLDLQAPAYIVNGNYELVGDVTGTLRKVSPTLNCVTELNFIDLKIDKSDLKISGGTGTVKVTGTAANGETKTIEGSIVFNGDGAATVTINGYVHTFQW